MSAWGVVIVPACPEFYNSPEGIGDVVGFVVARILDQMGVEHTLGSRCAGDEVNRD